MAGRVKVQCAPTNNSRRDPRIPNYILNHQTSLKKTDNPNLSLNLFLLQNVQFLKKRADFRVSRPYPFSHLGYMGLLPRFIALDRPKAGDVHCV